MGPLHYHHISTLPRIHHVVWCCLPDPDGHPGSTVRPALIRATKRHPPTKRGAVWVSYGTTKLESNKYGQTDLIIQNAGRLDQLGLPMAVRFDLSTANWLPWVHEFFQPPEHSLYVVAGPLTGHEIVRLRARLAKRGFIQAL